MQRPVIIALAGLIGCAAEPPDEPIEAPVWDGPRFADETSTIGLDITNPIVDVEHCAVATFMAHSASAADIDGDGDDDLFVPNSTGPDRLFENVEGRFEARAFDGEHGAGALFFDVDGDDDRDLFVTSIGFDPPRLYRNDGGTFIRVDGGLSFPTDEDGCHHLFGASAADYDRDGDLDLFTAAWVGANGSRLFENDGSGMFTDRTEAVGLHLDDAAGLVPFPIDLDEDGHLDFVLGADFKDTRIFMGRADHTFVEVTSTSTLARLHDLMGLDAADIDGDDDLDLFGVGVCHRIGDHCNSAFDWTGNFLFERTANDWIAHNPVTLGDAGWAWGSVFFDADLDGDPDLVIASGYKYLPHFEGQPVRLLINDGHGDFVEQAAANGLIHTGQSRTILPFDPDNDGDLDLLIASADGPPRFFRNHTTAAGLTVTLDAPNHGDGATVRAVLDDGRTLRRDLHHRTTFLASRPARLHFGNAAHIDRIEVTWPNGTISVRPGSSGAVRIAEGEPSE